MGWVRACVSPCVWLGVAACGFRHGGYAPAPADGLPDVAIDAYRASPTIYATDPTNLYTIDVASKSYAVVGPLNDPAGNSVGGVDAIAYADGTLYVIGANGSDQSFGTIDRATGVVTFASAPLAARHSYYGLTYDVATRTLLAATADDMMLYRIDPAGDGTAIPIGSFGNGLAIYGDIAWLDGVVYGTMTGSQCNSTCIATIDPATGVATVLATNAPPALPSMSAFGGKLYAMSGGGDVYSVSTSTGATTMLYNAGGKDLGDSAP